MSTYGLKNIAIFGSYSRDQQNDASDLDILVEFSRPVGIEFIDLAEELEGLLNIKVDLVSRNGVRPEYFQQIESDLNYV
jgi:predicted nucleotidyltransferase